MKKQIVAVLTCAALFFGGAVSAAAAPDSGSDSRTTIQVVHTNDTTAITSSRIPAAGRLLP